MSMRILKQVTSKACGREISISQVWSCVNITEEDVMIDSMFLRLGVSDPILKTKIGRELERGKGMIIHSRYVEADVVSLLNRAEYHIDGIIFKYESCSAEKILDSLIALKCESLSTDTLNALHEFLNWHVGDLFLLTREGFVIDSGEVASGKLTLSIEEFLRK